jgi:hypothetical protein
MEWLAQLQGLVVGLDTAPLIYFIEENSTYLKMRAIALQHSSIRRTSNLICKS